MRQKRYTTAVAAALDYCLEEMDAPLLAARGHFEVAAQMQRVARRYGVPIVERPELAERLAYGELDNPIHRELFADVAEVLVSLKGARPMVREMATSLALSPRKQPGWITTVSRLRLRKTP